MRYCYVAYRQEGGGSVTLLGVYETVGAAKGACTDDAKGPWEPGTFRKPEWEERVALNLYTRGPYRVLQVPYKLPHES